MQLVCHLMPTFGLNLNRYDLFLTLLTPTDGAYIVADQGVHNAQC